MSPSFFFTAFTTPGKRGNDVRQRFLIRGNLAVETSLIESFAGPAVSTRGCVRELFRVSYPLRVVPVLVVPFSSCAASAGLDSSSFQPPEPARQDNDEDVVSCLSLGEIVRSRIGRERFDGVQRLVIVGDRLEVLDARGADRAPRIEDVEIAVAAGLVAFVRRGQRVGAGQHVLAQNHDRARARDSF